ncbi:MAG: DUF1565 domain-containing protein [Bacteroidales bacterium]|nr:DUF1565 domain-containing protein [Bacteroidales bacterium]
MKRLCLLIALVSGLVSAINAQWISPGNGTTYTFPDLVNVTNGTVVEASAKSFTVTADLTISTNDVLLIDDQVKMIEASGALITIQGSMICENTGNDRVWIYGNESSQFSMRFENATADIKRIYFNEGAGIKLIESDVTIDDSQFIFFSREYASGVLDVFNCDPVIKNCSFTWNEGPAVCSPANGRASVQILNCLINSNVTTEGLNMPQINLGPGGDDTIRIVGNEISGENAHWFVGGVSVADLVNTGSTKVLLKDNLITYGRYGYNQQGFNISSVIVGNQIVDNFCESNPMNGGSGISINGSAVYNTAYIRNNVITGNLWGITAIYMHNIDLGTEDDWGNNVITNNYNYGLSAEYDLYNNSGCAIMAVGNDWGFTDQQIIENHIVHQVDDPSYGLVTYIPFIGDDGIGEIPVEANTLNDNLFYTVEGRCLGTRLPENYKGVYILNGKKFVK